jgi:isopentenyldiphosphate isomerase
MPAPTAATLIDVVNTRDEAVGRTPRGQVLEAGQNFRTTHVFVLNGRGELLLQRLSPARERHPHRWGSSVAAYLYAGEDYAEAARRRLAEELGLTSPLDEMGKLEMIDERSLKFVCLFKTQADQPSIREPGHIDGLEFLPLDWIRTAVAEDPDRFTPTFRDLFAKFWRELP